VDFASAAQVHTGNHAIAMTVTSAGGGLCLAAASPVSTAQFGALSFAARAAQAGGRYQLFLYDKDMQPLAYVRLAGVGGDPSPDAWTVYTLPLTSLGAAGQQVKGIGLQAIDGTVPETLYVDDMAFVTCAPVTTTSLPAPGPDGALSVYADSLASGWNSCSWDAKVDLGSTVQAHGGSRSIAATITAPRGGLCLTSGQAFDSTPYGSLSFAARAAQNGARFQAFLYDKNMQPLGYVPLATAGGDPTSDAWTVYTLPLVALGGAQQQIKGLAVQAIAGPTPATVYVDDITFTHGAPAATRASGPIALGAYVEGAPANPAILDTYTAAAGAAPAVVMWYQDWGTPGSRNFDPQSMNAVVARGAMPMVTWQPWGPPYKPSGQPQWALARITAGDYDAYVHQWAHDAAAWGKPMYLRFAHEMNGDWNTWSPGVNGNTPADYVAAWRHVHDIFLQESATNVRWVWSPNVVSTGDLSILALYPGDAYVDWIALDGYNWGTSDAGKTWQDFAAIFGYSYDLLVAAINKPIMVAETGSSELGGDKAGWITQGLLTQLPARMPAVRALIWFDEDKETDWRIDSSAASLAAFRQVVQSPAYRGTLP
jgi:beta-mannanase